jgi:hypothetical protein
MALAVIRGDRAAAYALADKLVQESQETQLGRALRERAVRDAPVAGGGYALYSWPEFQAFCRRLGVLWDLRTVKITLHLGEGEAVRVVQEYMGSDVPGPAPEPDPQREI